MTAVGCGKAPAARRFSLQGQVIAIEEQRTEATIKHEDVQGLMPAMTMPFKVAERALLDGVNPGDLIDATLVIVTNDAYLVRVHKVGHAPLERAAARSDDESAASGFELLKRGEAVPDAAFIDQDGRHRRFSSFAGSTLVVTFIYTRCPLPTFCPLMDRQFASIQRALAVDAALGGRVHLLTISFDPSTDTPPVLKAHAGELGADLGSWTFLTGDRDEIDRFARRFGVSVTRAPEDPLSITHNLRTAIVDADGTFRKAYTGNAWTVDEVLTDLRTRAR